MELHKLNTDEIRGLEAAKLRETEIEIRKSLAGIRMDIYTAKNSHAAKIKGLRRSLARLLTIGHQAALKAGPAAKKPVTVAAPKVAKPAKPAKAESSKSAAPSAAKPAKGAKSADKAAKSSTKTATKKK